MTRTLKDLTEQQQKLFQYYDWLPTQHLIDCLSPLWAPAYRLVCRAAEGINGLCDGVVPKEDEELVSRYCLVMTLRFPIPVLERWNDAGPGRHMASISQSLAQEPSDRLRQLRQFLRTATAVQGLRQMLLEPVSSFSIYGRGEEPLYPNLNKLASLSLGPFGLGSGTAEAVAQVTWNTGMHPFRNLQPVGTRPQRTPVPEQTAPGVEAAAPTPPPAPPPAPPPRPAPTVTLPPLPVQREISVTLRRECTESGRCSYWVRRSESQEVSLTQSEVEDIREEASDEDDFLERLEEALKEAEKDDYWRSDDVLDRGEDNHNSEDWDSGDISVSMSQTRLRRALVEAFGPDIAEGPWTREDEEEEEEEG